jgi:hypothetical protein
VKIKVWCSCIRSDSFKEASFTESEIISVNETPMEGDIIIVKALTEDGAYSEIENLNGRNVRIYKDDIFVGVLGTRKSGTNITASIPKNPIKKGDKLNLVSNGGLIAQAIFIPSYYGGKAMHVEVQGFFSLDGKRSANLRDYQFISNKSVLLTEGKKIIFVVGTSAESGKTTIVCESLRAVKKMYPSATVGVIKGAGTGRLKDSFRYIDSGADYVTDFVDVGWPSTYNISTDDYINVINSLVTSCLQHSKLIFIEIGGDLLEAKAPVALNIASQLKSPIIFVVNDAMGAIAGMQQLKANGNSDVTVVTMRQNQQALSERLQIFPVIDPLDEDQIQQMILKLLPQNFF